FARRSAFIALADDEGLAIGADFSEEHAALRLREARAAEIALDDDATVHIYRARLTVRADHVLTWSLWPGIHESFRRNDQRGSIVHLKIGLHPLSRHGVLGCVHAQFDFLARGKDGTQCPHFRDAEVGIAE